MKLSTSAGLALALTKLALSLFKYSERQTYNRNLRNEYAVKHLEATIRVQERREALTDKYNEFTRDQLRNSSDPNLRG